MPEIKRTVKFVTHQKIVDTSGEPPLREWSVEIFVLNQQGEQVPATIFDKAVYRLHETFNDRQVQTIKKPPFKIQEEGWGEFDMLITLSAIDKGGDFPIQHDLNFQSERYESKHPITFKNPKPGLLAALKELGPVPGDTNGIKGADSAKKKRRPDKGIDMDKLADNLEKMSEDDLLLIVQMIHDKKSPETMVRNDVEQGEFHVDLYTLPDSLVRELYDFTAERVQPK